MAYVLVGAIGFLIGLAAHDLALQGLSEATPLRPLVGVCHQCGHRRGWLRPRCAKCAAPGRRELLLAVLTALVALAFYRTVGGGLLLYPYLGFLLLSPALIVTDLIDFRTVDRLNLRGSLGLLIALAGVGVILGQTDAVLRGMAGGAAYFAGSSLVFIAVRGNGFGAGDVKLSFQLGLFAGYLSWGTLGWAVFATAMIGGVAAIALVLAGRAGMKTELAYGPPMILAAWLAISVVGMGLIPVPS